MKCLNKEINCDGSLWQEHSKMYDRNHPEKTVMIDNWHCKKCKSVFSDKEVKEALDNHDCHLSSEDGCNCQQ